jgi:hypothetical protein
MSADTETSATFRRTTAVHPKGRGKAKKYALSRVVMPEDARPRGTRIDVRDCVRTLQDALEERGWASAPKRAPGNSRRAYALIDSSLSA